MALSKGRMASALLGFGPGGGGLQKLRITCDRHDGTRSEPIEVLFNPREISRSRSVSWHQGQVASQGGGWTWSDTEQRFRAVEAETLSVELFFDTYESRTEASGWQRAASFVQPVNPFQTGSATDVTTRTDEIAKLAKARTE